MTDTRVMEFMSQIEAAQTETVTPEEGGGYSGLSFLKYMLSSGAIAPKWWSEERDMWLRAFWKDSDHLSGAIYTMQTKIATTPIKVIPDNPNDIEKVQLARQTLDNLMYASGHGKGFYWVLKQFIEDLLGQDRGAFMEVLGAGPLDGPIEGLPIGVNHLDSGHCQLTGESDYPVIFHSEDGGRYKLHFTRVIHVSQMPSSIHKMYGVGFCAVSRAIMSAQNMMDIMVYKMEKMGSRPHRAIGITKGGLDPDDVADAFMVAGDVMDSAGQDRFANMVITGDRTIPDADLSFIDLASLPDGFDEETTTAISMAIIALAFGLDPRELFPMMGAGATRADALLQHIKARTRGVGDIILELERQINAKMLPSFLTVKFDHQDDAQDRQVAEIRSARAQRRQRDLVSGVTSERVERQEMLEQGEITRGQFVELELEDGRLPTGADLYSLFYAPDYKDLLGLSLDQPDNLRINDPEQALNELAGKLSVVRAKMASTDSANEDEVRRLRYARAALERLTKDYEKRLASDQRQEQEEANAAEGMRKPNGKPGDRFQRGDPFSPGDGGVEQDDTQSLNRDDEQDQRARVKWLARALKKLGG